MNAFLIEHRDGPILIDTSIGPPHRWIDQTYKPVRQPLREALATIRLNLGDVSIIVNTHLHFDHCGSNRLFPGAPIFVQGAEFEAAHEENYTIREFVDFVGAKYELSDGEAEVALGVRLIPTSGHTRGHQSVALETDEGLIIIAGQAAETADEFGRLKAESSEGVASLQLLHDLAPARVYFSHDNAVWEPA